MFKNLVRQFNLNFSISYALQKTIQEGIIDSATILQTVYNLTKYETPLQTSPRNGERL